MRVAGILLAAGRSTRFGSADKLAAPLAGKPLIAHAADAMAACPLAWRFVVGADANGYRPVALEDGEPAAMSRSLRAGVVAARVAGADAVLVTLADMPFVTPDHLAALLACEQGAATLVASSDGTRPSPPALFGSAWFTDLEALAGDHGARHLLARARHIPAASSMLMDIDTIDDLARAEAVAHHVT